MTQAMHWVSLGIESNHGANRPLKIEIMKTSKRTIEIYYRYPKEDREWRVWYRKYKNIEAAQQAVTSLNQSKHLREFALLKGDEI